MRKTFAAAAAAVVFLLGVVSAHAQDNGSRTPRSGDAGQQAMGKPEWNAPVVLGGTTVLAEDFADITTLAAAGWVTTNQSMPLGTTEWFQGNNTVFTSQAGADTAYIGANFNNTAGAGTIDNWLITPVLPLSTLQQFSFWSRSPDGSTFPDRIQVRMNVTNTGSNTADFSVVLADLNPTSIAGWAQTVITAFPGAPAQGRLAFRYFVTDGGPSGSNSDYIGIDSVAAVQVSNTLSLGAVGAMDVCASTPSNNNSIIEPGERVTFTLPIQASGSTFTNVAGVLTSTSSGVTIESGMGSYGTIAAGSSASATYTVRLAESVSCNSTLNLSLAVSSTQGNYTFPITRPVGQSAAINYSGLPAAIPDNNPAGGSSTATVSGVPGPLTGVSVRVSATHTWVGDLTVRLTSPGGTTVTLLDRPGVPASGAGCNNNNLVDVLFADGLPDPEASCDPAGTGAVWPVSSAGPATPLSALNGQNGNGTWTLTVVDGAAADTGSITGWSLILNPAPVGTCTVCVSPPVFAFGSSSLSFGQIVFGATSGPQMVTLSNSGSGAGSLDSLTFAGPFQRSGGTCGALPFALAPGASCTIGVVFNGTTVGNATGSLTAVASGQTVVATLTGVVVPNRPAVVPVDQPWALLLLAAVLSLIGGWALLRRQ